MFYSEKRICYEDEKSNFRIGKCIPNTFILHFTNVSFLQYGECVYISMWGNYLDKHCLKEDRGVTDAPTSARPAAVLIRGMEMETGVLTCRSELRRICHIKAPEN